jgi:hypothetical protein
MDHTMISQGMHITPHHTQGYMHTSHLRLTHLNKSHAAELDETFVQESPTVMPVVLELSE